MKKLTQSHRKHRGCGWDGDRLFERGLQDRQDTLRGRMGQDSRIFDLSAGWKHVVPSTKKPVNSCLSISWGFFIDGNNIVAIASRKSIYLF